MPFRLIKEIGAEISLAEEQPAPARGAAGFPLLKKGAIGSNARARANHNRGNIVGRQPEMGVALDIDGQEIVGCDTICKQAGGNASPRLSMQLVAHGSDRQMSFVRRGSKARRQRIEARLERA